MASSDGLLLACLYNWQGAGLGELLVAGDEGGFALVAAEHVAAAA
jgi:hypothetical protein